MKPRWSLLPWDALGVVLGAFEFGARKYDVGDWAKHSATHHVDGAMRHLTAWLRGERSDPETGAPHLSHAGARVLMALAIEVAEVARGQKNIGETCGERGHCSATCRGEAEVPDCAGRAR